MERLALTPAQLDGALEVLGPDLEGWRIALRESFGRRGHDESTYDSYVHAPILAQGQILVDPKHVSRLLAALAALERRAQETAPRARVTALAPVRAALRALAQSPPRRDP